MGLAPTGERRLLTAHTQKRHLLESIRAGAFVHAGPEGPLRWIPGNGEPLVVRVGIATGLVVVGELVGDEEARERAVVGETPNLAARLQSLAEPNSVVISPNTHRLVGESQAESRFEALHPAALTPMARQARTDPARPLS